MGKDLYKKEIEQLLSRSPVIRFDSIARIIKNKNPKATTYARLLVRNLVSQKKMYRLTKGCYTSCEDASLLVLCLQPAYLGLQDALSIHGLWEQETIPVIVTTRRVRQGIRRALGSNVMIRRLEPKYFFGIDYVQQHDLALPVSTIEKTFIDLVHYKQYIRPDVLRTLRKKISPSKLSDYLKSYPKKFRRTVKRAIKNRTANHTS